jgi:ATP-binding cassette, subfamily B, multidrug efflux pump
LKHLLRLNHFFVRYKWHFILGIVFVSLANYFGILIPQKIREALDLVQGQISLFKTTSSSTDTPEFDKLSQQLFYFGLTITAFVILKGIFMFLMRQTIIVMSRLIEYDMRKDIYAHLQGLDQEFFRQRMTGDLMARVSEDVSKVRNYIGPGVLYAINLITTFVFTIIAMLKVDVTLTIYTLLPLPILSISIYYISNLINEKSGRIQAQLSTLTSETQESYSGIKVLKSYVKEDSFLNFFELECEEFKNRSMSLARVEAYFQPLIMLLIALSTIIVVVVGAYQVKAGLMTAGNIAEFILYVNMLTWPVTAIGWIASTIQEAEASQARINELMDSQPILNQSGSIILKNPYPKIEFRNVSFTYTNTGIQALKNISFTLLPGERMSIMGKTASGKSTISELLTRIYDVTEGLILIDDIDIKAYDLQSLRKNIGYVPQDVFLFSDTIKTNISYGKTDATDQEIVQHTINASIYDEIMSLPNGFDTMIGERGVTLSGGQKQRLSLARAFLKKAPILLLDDVLSAVDAVTEEKIIKYFKDELADITIIFTTHRINTKLGINLTIVLDDGVAIEQGSHETLIALNGHYYSLFEQQLSQVN